MTEVLNLQNLLLSNLDRLIALNKSVAKVYLKLSKAALAPELAKALDPEQTYVNNHTKRLKLIKKLLPKSTNIAYQHLTINPFKYSKIKSTQLDITICDTALLLLAVQDTSYQLLLKLINAQNLEHAPELIDQCIIENRDTEIWIKRTLNNLIHS